MADTDGVIAAIADGGFDLSGYDAFIARHLGAPTAAPASASSSGSWRAARRRRGDTLRRDVRHAVKLRPRSATPPASPGPLALIREGISDIRSRRRLVRYLVQADMRKRGADTLLGNFWWVLDPLLQMVVYVVFITIIFRGTASRTTRSSSSRRSCRGSGSARRSTTRPSSVVSQERLIKQIQFPKIVLPVAADDGGRRGLRVRADPARGLLLLVYPRPPVAVRPAAPGRSRSSSTCSRWPWRSWSRRSTCSSATSATSSRHVLRLWCYLSPGLYSLTFARPADVVREPDHQDARRR